MPLADIKTFSRAQYGNIWGHGEYNEKDKRTERANVYHRKT